MPNIMKKSVIGTALAFSVGIAVVGCSPATEAPEAQQSASASSVAPAEASPITEAPASPSASENGAQSASEGASTATEGANLLYQKVFSKESASFVEQIAKIAKEKKTDDAKTIKVFNEAEQFFAPVVEFGDMSQDDRHSLAIALSVYGSLFTEQAPFVLVVPEEAVKVDGTQASIDGSKVEIALKEKDELAKSDETVEKNIHSLVFKDSEMRLIQNDAGLWKLDAKHLYETMNKEAK